MIDTYKPPRLTSGMFRAVRVRDITKCNKMKEFKQLCLPGEARWDCLLENAPKANFFQMQDVMV